ncbi:YbdD/YjiX family protein [Streptomyces qinzhouensis]|uniref:YbdD/YjiX family protein n=1 Tax=Streptomyces qinzhouensis TaxID=2599401 RepID=A0A5B8JRE6_9ACTN|nr:YbdD/YjiX family protein [Streptomyces qinzhouensis]QDY80550.1 YbdD/YjiX family protein [Streptomyces qinzhouensis]
MTARGPGGAVRRGLRAVYWYVREVSGDTAYDRYCAHRRRVRPDEPVPTRREFQRQRARKLAETPQSRCC